MQLKEERGKLKEAYELGYAQTENFNPSLEIPEWEDMSHDDKMQELSMSFEGYTSYAGYANNILPTLRQLAGFEDSGYGTYQNSPNEEATYFYHELVDMFQLGYDDGFLGRSEDVTRHIGSDPDRVYT